VKTLLLDNYDSFTFNLHQAVAQLTGDEPLVFCNDRIDWDVVVGLDVDAVIISPGPGRPDSARDFGICRRVIEELTVPLLGVCLGHQGIGYVFGGEVTHAPETMHGRISRIHHDGRELFARIPQGFEAVRYHSLMVRDSLPAVLEKTAWTEDGVVMGLRHRTKPIWGVQFHPESICTSHGKELLGNFYDLVAAHWGTRRPLDTAPQRRRHAAVPRNAARMHTWVKKLPARLAAEQVFVRCFADAPYAFWLDSNKDDGWCGRFSFMGGDDAQHAEIVRYDVADGAVRVEKDGCETVVRQELFTYLRLALADRFTCSPDLPVDFNGGYVGYFGYELKADCGGRAAQTSTHADATFMFVRRQIVFDHEQNEMYLVWLGGPHEGAEAEHWFSSIADRITCGTTARPDAVMEHEPCFTGAQSKQQYVANILRCLDYIRDGESYEICLTNRLTARTDADPLEYYRVLRQINPAPHSAFLRLGSLAVACSSPERFLRVTRDQMVETKPIKGTARRGRTPEEDERLRTELASATKTRAENLMIVDLLRNDLGRVCEIGSVMVPKLMHVETYATVHQLVSTVTGRLREGCTAVECVREAFPGGSMTGAPKVRTLEIIDQLESVPRGIYSGAIGFLALNGSASLNVVIRTAVFNDGEVSIGTGGAIVALSDPEYEWDEMSLKARALVDAFEQLSTGKRSAEAGISA